MSTTSSPSYRLLAFLGARATLMMAASVGVGLLWQDLAAALAPVVLLASMGTMYLSAVRLDGGLLVSWLRRPALPAAIVVWTMLVLPVAGLALSLSGLLPPSVSAAVVLIAATSPIISVGAYCVFLGTDTELLTLAVLPATVLTIVMLPAFAAWVGIEGLAPAALVLTLLLVVGTSLGGAALTRVFVRRARLEHRAVQLDAAMVILIAIVAIGVTDGLRGVIVQRPGLVLEYFLWAFGLNVGLQAITWAAFSRLSAPLAASAALASGFRNMALLLGLVLGKVDPELQLLLVLGQLQLFLLPALMRPVYAWFGVSARLARPAAPSP